MDQQVKQKREDLSVIQKKIEIAFNNGEFEHIRLLKEEEKVIINDIKKLTENI